MYSDWEFTQEKEVNKEDFEKLKAINKAITKE